MNDAALFDATVPVFRHYLSCIERLLTTLPDADEPLLQQRLTTHAFTASEHLQTAIGFASRTVMPLLGRAVVESEHRPLGRDALIALVRAAEAPLRSLTADDFNRAGTRVIRHTAGTAELDQEATMFVTTFAVPNFFFHYAMAFAILRQGGASIGKGDFDGQHRYAADFHF